MLNTTKQVLTQHIDEESTRRHKSESDVKDMLKKIQVTKMKLEVSFKAVLYKDNYWFISLKGGYQ